MQFSALFTAVSILAMAPSTMAAKGDCTTVGSAYSSTCQRGSDNKLFCSGQRICPLASNQTTNATTTQTNVDVCTGKTFGTSCRQSVLCCATK
ncbi:hypothetical protein WAI453_007150 [Rhynchosporium graminicola]